MAGNAVTGQFGDVKVGSSQILEVGKWSFEPKVPIYVYASNKTGGFKQRTAGPKDGTGSIDGYYDPANPIATVGFDIGQSVTLKLYIDAVGFYGVPCIIESLKMDVQIETGDYVKWTATFQLNGAYTNPGAGLEAEPPMEETAINPNTMQILTDSITSGLQTQLDALKQSILADLSLIVADAANAAVERYMANKEHPATTPVTQAV